MNEEIPDIVVLDVSCESHEELVECLPERQLDYVIREYGNDPNYAIYRRVKL
jgi:hypothetical protein